MYLLGSGNNDYRSELFWQRLIAFIAYVTSIAVLFELGYYITDVWQNVTPFAFHVVISKVGRLLLFGCLFVVTQTNVYALRDWLVTTREEQLPPLLSVVARSKHKRTVILTTTLLAALCIWGSLVIQITLYLFSTSAWSRPILLVLDGVLCVALLRFYAQHPAINTTQENPV